MLRTGGFLYDMEYDFKDDGSARLHFLLCAAWRAGLVGWVITEESGALQMYEDFDFSNQEPYQARAVKSLHHEGDLYAVVGTFEDWENGILYILKIYKDAQGDYHCDKIWEESINGGVYGLDITTELGADPTLFVAATAGGILRYKIKINDPSDKLQHENTYCPQGGIFARDVLVAVSDSANHPKTLYAACYQDGVLTFDVSASGGLAQFSSVWSHLNLRAVDALDWIENDLFEGHDLLFVACGPPFKDEYIYYGDSDKPVPPAGGNTPISGGIFVYNVDDPSDPGDPLGFVEPDGVTYSGLFWKPPVDVAALSREGLRSMAFLSVDAGGMTVMQLLEDTSVPPREDIVTYTITGAYNQLEETFPVPLGSLDDGLVQNVNGTNYLYTASEGGVQVYDLSDQNGTLHDMDGWSFVKSSILFSANPGVLLYGYGQTQGTIFWKIQTDPLDPEYTGALVWNENNEERTACSFPIGAGTSWRLYVAHGSNSSQGVEGSFAVYRVDQHTDPRYCTRLGRWDSSEEEEALGNYCDVAAVQHGNDQVAYVTFGPSTPPPPPQQVPIPVSGLHCFKVEDVPGSEQVDITFLKTIIVNDGTAIPPDGVDHGKGARLVLHGDRLYGAFGRGGIAVFDLSSPANPTLIGKRRLSQGSILQIRPFEEGGTFYAYVPLLSGHLAVMKVSNQQEIENTTYLVYDTTFQCASVAFDPADGTHRKLFITDGRGGVHHVEVPNLP